MKEIELPDFDEMIRLTREIGILKSEILIDEARLDVLLAQITELVTTDDEYFINNRPPSMAHVKSHYHQLGVDEESKIKLVEVRKRIAENEGKLKEREMLFDVYRSMIDVWRTESANKRGSYYEGI